MSEPTCQPTALTTPPRLALFDLDHTLIPVDSDYEWGQFLCRIGAVDKAQFEQRNKDFFAQYQAGCLDAREYLAFAFQTLAQFSPGQLEAMHQQFMQEVIHPVMHPAAHDLLAQHQNDLVIIVTATNRFVTEPIARAFGVTNLIAAQPAYSADGRLTGELIGTPTSGPGKVEHLNAWLAEHNQTLANFERSYFYSDSHNDLPLLELVSHPVATNPNAQLFDHARSRGWPILTIFDDKKTD